MYNLIELIAPYFVCFGILSAAYITWDIFVAKHTQPMRVMQIVWPLTALWGSIFGLLAYFMLGRTTTSPQSPMQMNEGMEMKQTPIAASNSIAFKSVALSALHCGAGCTLADIIGEWLTFIVPVSFAGSYVWGGWGVDYLFALAIGILFQYAAIQQMERLSPQKAFTKAFKVDFWSLTSWQVGMYGWMAIVIWVFDWELAKTSWSFWFMMQVAMLCGFITAFPTNYLLIRLGIKKAM